MRSSCSAVTSVLTTTPSQSLSLQTLGTSVTPVMLCASSSQTSSAVSISAGQASANGRYLMFFCIVCI